MEVDADHAIPDMNEERLYDYMKKPWEMRNNCCIVCGTNTIFEINADGGPVTKYAALFDLRPEFDALRIAFLHQIGGKSLRRVEKVVKDVFPILRAPIIQRYV